MFKKIVKANRNVGTSDASVDLNRSRNNKMKPIINTLMPPVQDPLLSPNGIDDFNSISKNINVPKLGSGSPKLKKVEPITIQKMEDFCKEKNVFFNDDDRVNF